MSNRAKLDTAIERQLHKLVDEVKEHTFDFVMLYVRRNKMDIDGNVLRVVLDIVDKAIMDGYQRNVDTFMRELDSKLTEFTSEENPFQSSGK